jgi:hypothetical protein
MCLLVLIQEAFFLPPCLGEKIRPKIQHGVKGGERMDADIHSDHLVWRRSLRLDGFLFNSMLPFGIQPLEIEQG